MQMPERETGSYATNACTVHTRGVHLTQQHDNFGFLAELVDYIAASAEQLLSLLAELKSLCSNCMVETPTEFRSSARFSNIAV